MKEGQDKIYYISGEDEKKLSQSPHLEGFKAKGIEVIYMTDPVDEFWLPSVGKYSDKDFQSIVSVGDKIPNNLLMEDEVLLQFYDIASTRV